MTELDTIPESAVRWPEPPRLLIEWSSPWQEFKSAFRPALTRAPKRSPEKLPSASFPIAACSAPGCSSACCSLPSSCFRKRSPAFSPSFLLRIPPGMSSTTPETNSPRPPTAAERNPASPDTPEASRPTTARKPSGSRAATSLARGLSTPPKSICRTAIPRSPICSLSNPIPVRLPPKACIRPSSRPCCPT